MNASDTRLLLALSKAQNLQELADLGCTLLGNPVFIDDMNRNILAYSGNVSIDDPLWQKNIVENLHDESLKSRRDSKEFYRKSLDTAHPVLLTDLETVPRYAMTLTNFGVPIGNATVASHLKAFEEGDEELFELFCSGARNLLTCSRFSTRKNQHLATNTLIRLLDGQPMTRSAVESKLESFFKGKSDRHIFLLAISDETGDALS